MEVCLRSVGRMLGRYVIVSKGSSKWCGKKIDRLKMIACGGRTTLSRGACGVINASSAEILTTLDLSSRDLSIGAITKVINAL